MKNRLPNDRSPGRGRHHPRTDDLRRWYFVCLYCGAKWFAEQRQMQCPRCGTPHRSQEQLVPPWVKTRKTRSGLRSVPRMWHSGTSYNLGAVGPSGNNCSKHLIDLRQLRRNLCDLVGNVLRSLRHAYHGRHFLDQALCFRCTSRSHHHRLEAALGPLGSKPVACTGSILRFIAGDIQCRSTFLNRSAAQAQPSHN